MIKVTVGEQKTQSEKPFPKIMKAVDGTTLVLVLEEPDVDGLTKDLYLNEFREYPYACGFTLDGRVKYTDYNEPITLQNE